MINELVIHLGDTKTGSTSIQKALLNKACDAPGKTIKYPTINNHIGMAKTLGHKRLHDRRPVLFNKVYKAFRASDADYGVISAEHFQYINPETLHQAIDTYWPALKDRLRLVAYVRPHSDKVLSEFSERVKLGTVMESLDDFSKFMFDVKWMDYTSRFKHWKDVFGERFELRPFVRDRLYQSDVVTDFYKFVFQSESFELQGGVSANTSLTLSQLALLREMHRNVKKMFGSRDDPGLNEVESALGRFVADHIQANGLGRDSSKLRLPTSLVNRFKDRFAADAEALDKAFFDGSPMSDALENIHLKAIDTDQSLEAADYFSPDVINSVQIFANVLTGLLLKDPLQFRQTVLRIRAEADISS